MRPNRRQRVEDPNDRISSDGSDMEGIDFGMASEATGIKNIKRQKTTKDLATTEQELVELNETIDEKRRRLAKEYLASVGLENFEDLSEEEQLVHDSETDSDLEADVYKFDPIARALKQQALRVQGREKRFSTVDEMEDLKSPEYLQKN
eukprot:UN03239